LQIAENIQKTRKIECEFWYVTFYKKGTCHIEWKDKELIKKLNIFAGKRKNWLFDGFGEKEYNDLNNEEKTVCESFSGKKDYENIYKNRMFYLPKFDTLKLIS
jgi:hypothetical protein